MSFRVLFKSLTFSSIILLNLTNISQAQLQKPSIILKATPAANVQQATIYVNPKSGADIASAGKNETAAYRSISYALQQATLGITTIIQLAPGEYSHEIFPLIVKSNVIIKGNESGQGQGIEIIGGDSYMSPTFARQSVTIVAQENAQISGVTVTNPNSRGTGIWIESGQPIVNHNTFINNKREGVFVTGKAAPQIENNRFANNDANGISVAKEAKGEIRNNVFDNTGFGIAIGGNSAPLVLYNQIHGNRNGIVLTDFAQPRLQSNSIEDNSDYGLVIIGQAKPDLDRNNFKGNQKQDQFQVFPIFQQVPPE
jgi:parallel beta-helix repeat protein